MQTSTNDDVRTITGVAPTVRNTSRGNGRDPTAGAGYADGDMSAGVVAVRSISSRIGRDPTASAGPVGEDAAADAMTVRNISSGTGRDPTAGAAHVDGDAGPAGRGGRHGEAGVRVRAVAGVLRAAARHAGWVEGEVCGLASLAGPGDVVVDVGAEYGLYTWSLAALVGPGGAVHAVEPQPALAAFLRTGRHALGLWSVQVHELALAEAAGAGVLVRPRRLLPVPGRAFLADRARGLGSNAEFRRHTAVPVAVRTLDGLVTAARLDRVDLIKADVEGAEGLLLDGGRATIAAHRPLLLLELEDRHLGRFGGTVERVTGELADLGYREHRWTGRGWAPGTGPGRNVLFVPP